MSYKKSDFILKEEEKHCCELKKKFETSLFCACKFLNCPQNYQKLPQICSTNFSGDFGGFGTLWCGCTRVCPIKTSPDTLYNFQPPVPERSGTLVFKCSQVPVCVPLNLSGDSNWLLVFPSRTLPLIRDRELVPIPICQPSPIFLHLYIFCAEVYRMGIVLNQSGIVAKI